VAEQKTYPCVEVYQRVDKKWAWRLLAGNTEIIATDGGQGYENKSDAVDMVDRIVRKGTYKDVDIWRPKD
jgi:uncharacterized protein YegP (UPF0339 family)